MQKHNISLIRLQKKILNSDGNLKKENYEVAYNYIVLFKRKGKK